PERASTKKATRAAGATLGMGCLTGTHKNGTGLLGEVSFSLGGTELRVKCFCGWSSSAVAGIPAPRQRQRLPATNPAPRPTCSPNRLSFQRPPDSIVPAVDSIGP